MERRYRLPSPSTVPPDESLIFAVRDRCISVLQDSCLSHEIIGLFRDCQDLIALPVDGALADEVISLASLCVLSCPQALQDQVEELGKTAKSSAIALRALAAIFDAGRSVAWANALVDLARELHTELVREWHSLGPESEIYRPFSLPLNRFTFVDCLSSFILFFHDSANSKAVLTIQLDAVGSPGMDRFVDDAIAHDYVEELPAFFFHWPLLLADLQMKVMRGLFSKMTD
jgi:hypothetical protein